MLCSDSKLDYVAVLSRIELRSHSRILESRFAQQCCDLSWRPCPKREARKFAPKWFKFAPTAFRFCFTNLRQFAPNVSIFAQKSAPRPATSSLLCLQVSRRNCFAFNFAVRLCLQVLRSFFASKFAVRLCFQSELLVPSLLRTCKFRAKTASLASLLLLPIRTAASNFAPLCLQVSRQNCSDLSKNCAAYELPFCLNGSCDVAPVVHLSFTYRSPVAHPAPYLASHHLSFTYRSPSLLYPCFKTALCYSVVSGCFVRGVSPSPRFRPELAPERGPGGSGLAFRTPESAHKVHAKSFWP